MYTCDVAIHRFISHLTDKSLAVAKINSGAPCAHMPKHRGASGLVPFAFVQYAMPYHYNKTYDR